MSTVTCPELLRINEVAAKLRLSESAVRRLMREDPLFPRPITLCPGSRGKLRIRASELAQYIDSLS